jgi:ribosomal protection tetracycline resistance protein
LQRRTLNLGILAHVDAGKTTLTERLLYAAGIIDAPGSVDKGTTQTDSLALEQERGITIKSAVVSFPIDDVTVNLIDTPGHPDFIAEVERVLSVLDGAVLVLSAVEGVQAQTRILMRALQRLGVPTLIFVNKLDRAGARPEEVLAEIAEKLSPAIIATGSALDAGTRGARFRPYGAADDAFSTAIADLLADYDEALLAAYVDDETTITYRRLREGIAAQTKQARMHPVFLGSAITGAGVDSLMSGIAELLPPAAGDADGPVSGTVFKVERGGAGEKIAYVRMFSGTMRTRDRLGSGDDEQKVTAIRVFDRGSIDERRSVAAGEIAKVWGLGKVRIGDTIGEQKATSPHHHFAPPTLETVIIPRRGGDRRALHTAVAELAEQDPLINLRQDDVRRELFVSLYGEVQKEVIEETLASDFGIEVDFRETTTICIERPTGTAAAVEYHRKGRNPFYATVGLRVEPAPIGTGVRYGPAREVLGTLPPAFFNAVEDTVHETLRQGVHGWQVTDCAVTMTHSGYSPATVARDFRLLTPLVLMTALKQAGTVVCEPIHHFRLEFPADTLAAIFPALTRLDAVPRKPALDGASGILEGDVPAARMHELQLELRALTRGEAVLECVFDRYEPVRSEAPTRSRSDHNPLNREDYLLRVSRRRVGQGSSRARV